MKTDNEDPVEVQPGQDERDALIIDLQAKVERLRSMYESANKMSEDIAAAHGDTRKRLKDAEAEVEFYRETASALEKRLERAKGYIDRFLEQDDAYEAPKEHRVPASPLPKGPPISDIPLPRRRTTDDRPHLGGYAELRSSDEPRRRYS